MSTGRGLRQLATPPAPLLPTFYQDCVWDVVDFGRDHVRAPEIDCTTILLMCVYRKSINTCGTNFAFGAPSCTHVT